LTGAKLGFIQHKKRKTGRSGPWIWGKSMLTAIKKIQGLGVFGNFKAAGDLPEFGRFNVIYGENGSGKTTLSRLFSSLGSGAHADHPELAFTIGTQSGQLAAGQQYPRKVRVFNSDYVEANIGLFDGPLRHILIVGEENKALADEVVTEIATLDDRTKKADGAGRAAEKLEIDRGKIFSAIAKTIGEAISGSTLRSYRKPDAEAAFVRNRDPKTLDKSQLEVHRGTVRQEQLDTVPAIAVPTLMPDHSGIVSAATDAAGQISRSIDALLLRTAQAGVIKRLVEAPVIAEWVQEGIEIHRDHPSERCEFCDQALPTDRLQALVEHFGAEDQRFKREIEATHRFVQSIIVALASLTAPSKSALYAEMREDFDAAVSSMETAAVALAHQLTSAVALLEEKLANRSTSYSKPLEIDGLPAAAAIAAANAVIERHNAKSSSFEHAKVEARRLLAEHYLSTVAKQVREFDAQIGVQRDLAKKLTDGAADLADSRSLADIKESIRTKQAQVSNAPAGGAELTGKLRNFLGRTDLRFESGLDGYHVQRRGKPARRLSEGEKTAIAFLYFIVQLGDQDFQLSEGVVVIDDPISSLDSASIYQAFAFLKNAVKEAKQIFILTHNFDFLKLLINWFKSIKKAVGQRSYYMIVCADSESSRNARLITLDKLLLNHPTEYHYLFKILHGFKSDGTIMSAYHIPNVARKVLETFLEFHVPSDDSLYEKLEATQFDQNKKTAIYKFANDLSHHTGKGFDPALVAETQKGVTYLLEMIQAVAPSHFDGLEKLSKVA
jgi:wobble nucleotide-excising tRNase